MRQEIDPQVDLSGGFGGGGRSNRPHHPRRVPHWLIFLLVGALLVSIIGIFLSNAIVTITVKSYPITGVTGQPPDAAQLQISARQLTITSHSQAPVKGTGGNDIPGQQATGTLTFFNQFPSSQTVKAGTPFAVSHGVQIVTDQMAVIPADDNGTLGTTTVSAHATPAGVAGNIDTLTLNRFPCCSLMGNIQVSNTAAFTGGQDPQPYSFVKQSDVDAVANRLGDKLKQQSKDQLKAERGQGEMPIGEPQCGKPNVEEDQPIGDHGMNIPSTTITVSVTCNQQLYNQPQLQMLMRDQLKKIAMKQYGTNYVLSIGDVQVTTPTINPGSVIMQVDAKETFIKI